jgi:DNA invertase Pin-like site-specific DNA recombinase
MPPHSTTAPTVAYSYIRFSSREQARGDSLRRQADLAEAYCQRHGWTLDASLTLRDLGVSAFRGKNALVGNLGVFLQAVKRGTVPGGSVLIVESFDRISRQGIDEGYDLVKSILKAGVRIVTLSPEREFGPEAVKGLTKGALEIQLILERAAEESDRKSERCGAAWVQKREAARQGQPQPRQRGDSAVAGTPLLTQRLPAWLAIAGGKPRLIPAAASAVRRVCELAAAGYGAPAIVRKLAEEKVPPIGKTGKWNRSYVALLLRDRRVIGEYQPCRGKKPDGPPIPNYYPAAVDEALWLRARAGARQRASNRGRTGGEAEVNVFAGLLHHAREGDSYFMTSHYSRPRPGGAAAVQKVKALINANAHQGVSRAYSLPYLPFEQAIVSCLTEIDPHEILNGDHAPDLTHALRAEFEQADGELEAACAFMAANGFSPAIGKQVKALEDRKADLAARLIEARQSAAYPLSEAWGECQTLAGALYGAADPRDARLRLRSALRRVVESVWLLVVPRGMARLWAVQVWFVGGKRQRSYLVRYEPKRGASQPGSSGRGSGCKGRPEHWAARSLADVAGPADLDLRRKADAAALEKLLASLDPDTIA